ncbi:MAG TPA: tetratricopeptide repeat protein, partial [Opitutus sp.]|nr:tetratricopeptide repeat protein [Opitutus sp.]
YYFQTYEMLARLWAATGQAGNALDFFAALVDRMPGSSTARHIYASLLEAKGDTAAAEAQWRAILRTVPDDEAVLAPLLQRLQQRGKPDEALALMLAAQAYNPRNFRNNERLVAFYDARGDAANMVKYMRALAASGPVNAQLYLDLGGALEKLGRDDEARIAYRAAEKTAAGQHDAAAGAAAAAAWRRLTR